jgi:hypothetical protein
MTFTAADLPRGITFRSTPSHGYWILSAEKLAEMPEALQTRTAFYRGDGSFEEDLEYNRIILAFPESFPAEWVKEAHQIMKDSHPDIYEAWTGKEIPLEESREKRQRAFKEAHKNDYISMSASGDWHDNVPEGYVGVIAGRGGYVEHSNGLGMSYPDDTKEFLVANDRYKNPSDRPAGFSYVIDLEVDRQVNWTQGETL